MSRDGTARRRLFVVATSHLDSQWRWTLRETISTFLPHTADRNFRLFEKYPYFVLSFEGAFRYMLLREYYPQRYEELRRWVDRGRWKPVGSMLDAPDVNIPAPESLLRHVLYGNGFFERELGAPSADIFLPDCFGFGFALPSIAAHAGLVGFSSQKFIKWMRPAEPPFDVGWWEGPDGARILAALNPDGYGEPILENLATSRRWRRRLDRIAGEIGVAEGLKYFGIGDRGGAPDEASVVWLGRALAAREDVTVEHGSSDAFFLGLAPRLDPDLPSHAGELLLPTHGTGCWTSQAAAKRWNRRCEQLAGAAERAALVADWLGGPAYPAELLRDAWVRFLWHQMHDDLTGTSIPPAYHLTWSDQALALNRFATVIGDSVAAVSRWLDTRGRGHALVVFNPLGRRRRDPVEARIEFDGDAPAAVEILGPRGEPLPAQIVARSQREITLVFVPELAPLEFAVFDVLPATPGSDVAAGELEVSERHLANRRYRIEIDADGNVASVFLKPDGIELLGAPARLELLPDRSSRWPAWEILFADVAARPLATTDAGAAIEVVERGPARAALRVERRLGRSRIRQTLTLAAFGERLEIETEVDWRDRARLLKARFELPFGAAHATYDLGLGVIRRGVNEPRKYEVPAQHWADVSADGAGGLTVLSDSKTGWDRPDEKTLRLSLLRSPRARRRFRFQALQDLGRHHFVYGLYGHDGAAVGKGSSAAQAIRMAQPPLVFAVPATGDATGRRRISFLDGLPETVELAALKRAEDGRAAVLRLQELAGRAATPLALRLGDGVAAAHEVCGRERKTAPARVAGGRLEAEIGRFQPRSFALELAPATAPVARLEQQVLELERDTAAVSFHGARRGPDFDGQGRSLPGELLPGTVESGEIRFALEGLEHGGLQALACRGQEIELPAGWERLHLLACSPRDGGCAATFASGAAAVELAVDPWSGEAGSWWRQPQIFGWALGQPRPPWLRRVPIAWYASHCHDRRVRDRPYRFCYLYRYSIAVDTAGGGLRLPAAPIAVFAATLSRDGGAVRAAAPLYD